MKCPRCEVPLEEAVIRDLGKEIPTHNCPECEGRWFTKEAILPLERICHPTFWETRNISEEIDQLIGLHCPSCATHPLMKKAEHARDENVIMDFCPKCEGVWLDKGELKAIQEENWLIIVGRMLWMDL